MQAITFDVDNILIPQLEYIYKKYNIDSDRVTKYSIKDCELLSEVEKEIILEAFKDVRIFEEAGFIPEITELETIARYADLRIDSLSANNDIIDFKYRELKRLIPSLKDENIYLRLYEEDNVKRGIAKTDIFVDDSAMNLKVNYDRYTKAYTIKTSYNKESLLELEKVKVMTSVVEIIRTIIKTDLGL